MYNPPHFEETRRDVMHALIAAHPLGALVTLGPGGLDANHIPFEISMDLADGPLGTLRAHVARANPVWTDFSRVVDALVIFQGPQCYITPGWYVETKPDSGKVVPTWNYCVVHAAGPIHVRDDPRWVRAQVERLVSRHESTQTKPWHVSDAPADFIEKQIAAIVGIEIPISKLTGKWKVSQNRSAADRAGVVHGLRQEDTAASEVMAELVRARGVVKPRP
jgi:transcriptional regulator